MEAVEALETARDSGGLEMIEGVGVRAGTGGTLKDGGFEGGARLRRLFILLVGDGVGGVIEPFLDLLRSTTWIVAGVDGLASAISSSWSPKKSPTFGSLSTTSEDIDVDAEWPAPRER